MAIHYGPGEGEVMRCGGGGGGWGAGKGGDIKLSFVLMGAAYLLKIISRSNAAP